jgi:endonuclease YncB( thermonuclease family)
MSTRTRLRSAGGGRWTRLIFVAVIIMLPDRAWPETAAADAGFCRLPAFATGIAGAAKDGRTFALEDGREVRLAGIEVPALASGQLAHNAAPAAAATGYLQSLVTGRTVVLKGPAPDRDRYGRLVAQVDVRLETGERWVQAEMTAAGHSRVGAHAGDRGCTAELMRRERAARAAKLGLWSDPYYGMRRAEDPAAVSRERGRFTIVEGNVLSVRESGGTIYVNFGRRWSEDFTVTIAKRNERAFAAAGLEPKRLAGRRIRVRGFIEERGGPWVEASRPEQIEVMERN